ncbi:MAG: hypothetical protein JXR95_05730 [Deltaproteobacteria bacterium]|nr:hypothetical protein [Deltaproteobacteria bacterium]
MTELQITSEKIEEAVKLSVLTRNTDPLLSLSSPEITIPSIKPYELYSVIKNVGINDSTELLSFASPEQIQCFLDFDCWNRDNFLLAPFFDWTSALLSLGYEKIHTVFQNLDEEIISLILLKSCIIYNLREGDPPDDDIPHFQTPDSFFEISPAEGVNEDIWKNIIQLINYLYAGDINFAISTLTKSVWELPTLLEEQAYHWMNNRLEEKGFINYLDALSIYRFIPPENVTLDEVSIPLHIRESRVSLETAKYWDPSSDILEFMDQLSDDEIHSIRLQIAALINKMSSADTIPIDDDDGLRKLSELASSTIQLGLEFITKGDTLKIPVALHNISIQRIFRVGYSLLLQLKGLSQTLSRSGHISLTPRSFTLLEGSWSDFYRSLVNSHPVLHLGLKGNNEVVYFKTLRDVKWAGDIIEDMSSLKSLVFLGSSLNASLLTDSGVKHTNRKHPAEITFGDLLRTGLMLHHFNLPEYSIPEEKHIDLWINNHPSMEESTVSLMIKMKKNLKKHGIDDIPRLERIVATHLEPLYSGENIKNIVIYKK